MRQIVECAPNFSEGRRGEVVEQILQAIHAAGVLILDTQSDPDLNRTMVSFVGEIEAVEQAAVAGATMAADLIDMRRHRGEHPRIGATDVIPFVPVAAVSLEECIALAHRVGERLGRQLGIPVYLYGEAATRPERVELAAIRRGQYEGLREGIGQDPGLKPDYGPRALGPAGASAVGARHPIVKLNILLGTDSGAVASAVAAAVDEDSGGLRHVRAEIPGDEESPMLAISLLRHDLTPLARVIELVRREAGRYGVPVLSAELVGLVPQAALLEAAAWYLQLEFQPQQVIENRLLGWQPATAASEGPTPREFVEAVASEAPTPGSGSVAALAGALGAALNRMAANLTLGRQEYAGVEEEMKRLRARATQLQRALLELIQVDSSAFEAVMTAYQLPQQSTEEAEKRRRAIQRALERAIESPLQIMARAVEVLELACTAAGMGNVTAASEAGVAGHMAHAAVRGAALNVEVNVRGLRDLEEGDRYRRQSQELVRRAHSLQAELDRLVRTRIAGQG